MWSISSLTTLKVDVGFQQRHADFFQRLADVLFRQRALSAQVLEGALQFICEVLKHCSGVQIRLDRRSRECSYAECQDITQESQQGAED